MNIEVEDEEILEQFVKKHQDNYKEAVIEIIKNNTNTLLDEDIASLIGKPPLDSMDVIKQKLLSLAKKEDVILDNFKLEELLSNYRSFLFQQLNDLKEIRNQALIDKVISFDLSNSIDIIKIDTNDFSSINKKIKQVIKKILLECNNNLLSNNINKIYKDSEDCSKKEKVSKGFFKYMETTYKKQLLESIEIKQMIKDRTLVNGVIEQGERYLFTKSNSYIFNDKKLSANN